MITLEEELHADFTHEYLCLLQSPTVSKVCHCVSIHISNMDSVNQEVSVQAANGTLAVGCSLSLESILLGLDILSVFFFLALESLWKKQYEAEKKGQKRQNGEGQRNRATNEGGEGEREEKGDMHHICHI
jgi:hypothetical protein